MVKAFIRRARPDEAEVLSELAFRSKAFWGYDETFMASCRDELTVTPEALEKRSYYLLQMEGQIAGFYNLLEAPEGVYLHNLFIAPEFIGQGIGKQLWAHMVREAKALSYPVILIESDPHAEPFYLSRGAKRVRSVPSSVMSGRELPLLEFKVREVDTSGA